MIQLLHMRTLIAGKDFVRVKLRVGDVREEKGAFRADENRALIWQLVSFQQRLHLHGRLLVAVVPGDVYGLLGGKRGAGKDVADDGVDGPIPLTGRGTVGTDGDGRGELERIENRIEYVATHVAKSAGAEVQSLAPI